MSQLNKLTSHHLLSPFQLFKYTVYLLLIRNIFLFYREEVAAAALLEKDGVSLFEIIDVYAATIDTGFWVVLLLLFELETWVIPDRLLTNPVKTFFTVLRSICYASIVYALYGYIVTYFQLAEWTPYAAAATDLCANIGDSFMFSLERFQTITQENCATLATTSEFLVNKESLLIDSHHFHVSWMLAVADIINAADWLLVVLILEVEVWLQTQGLLKEGILRSVKWMKFVLYAVLGIIAVFWGIYGEFIDFWDAFLWIVAFMFIENNVLQWHKESQETEPVAGTV